MSQSKEKDPRSSSPGNLPTKILRGPPVYSEDILYELYDALNETCVCGEPDPVPVLFQDTLLLRCKICRKLTKRR